MLHIQLGMWKSSCVLSVLQSENVAKANPRRAQKARHHPVHSSCTLALLIGVNEAAEPALAWVAIAGGGLLLWLAPGTGLSHTPPCQLMQAAMGEWTDPITQGLSSRHGLSVRVGVQPKGCCPELCVV